METTTCNLCGSAKARHLYRVWDYFMQNPNIEGDYVQCEECGLVYQNPRPSNEELAKLYPEEYLPFTVILNPETQGGHFIQSIRTAGLRKRCQAIIRSKSGGRLLDIGCGTGDFLIAMAQIPGWELHGVELSPDAARIAGQRGLNIFTGMLEQAAYPQEFFDAITLWDVFEHLPDPSKSLMEIHRVLKPDGMVVLRLPNARSLNARLFGPYWAGFDFPRHLYVFDPNTLRQMLKQHGFKVLSITSNIGNYPSFVVDINQWLTAKRSAPQKRKKISSFFSSVLVQAIFAPLFFIVGRLRLGSGMVVRAIKNT
jgi:ubiquinone/menaquinone biosynthesis C-methylase UbiE